MTIENERKAISSYIKAIKNDPEKRKQFLKDAKLIGKGGKIKTNSCILAPKIKN